MIISVNEIQANNLNFIEKNMSQMKIRDIIKEAKSSILDVEEYKHLYYKEYVELIPSLGENKNLVKTFVLEEEYPFLTPNICDEGETCKTMMFEIVNQSLGRTKIKSMPTILVMAGFDGTENTGIRVITSMILLLQKMYTSIRDWYNLINTVRILAIPVINMQGFYNQVEFEQRTVNGKTVYPNPKIDFNLQTNQPCFLSLSAQFLSMIHQDNLIYGALLLAGSDFEIDYPRLKDIFPSYQENADDRIYEDVAKMMTKFYSDHRPDGTPEAVFDPNKERASFYSRDSGTYYQEWAYASSKNKKYVTKSCMAKTGEFAKKYLPPTENTHRTFVIGIGLNAVDKAASKQKNEPVMRDFALGNELYVINPTHPDAKKGLVSMGILFLNQFTKVMRPFSMMSDLVLKPRSEDDYFTSDLIFDIGVKGCLRVSDVSVTKLEPSSQEIVKVEKSSTTIVKRNFLVNVVYRGTKALQMNQPLDFEYTVNCNHHFADYQAKFGEPHSLFGLSQVNSDFYLEHNKWHLTSTNLESNTLRNLILNKVDKMLIFTKIPGMSLVFYQTVLPIQVGPFFPFNLTFDRSSGLVDFELNPQEIPPLDKPLSRRDFSTEFGTSTSITNAQNNSKLIRTMNDLLKVTDKKFRLFIYNNYIDFIRSEIKLENLSRFEVDKDHTGHNHSHGLASDNYERIQKEHDNLIYAKLTREVEHYFKVGGDSGTPQLTNDAVLDINDSSKSIDDKGKLANKLKQIYFAEFDKEIDDYMLPSAYLDLLGRPVTISFRFIPEATTEDDSTKKSLFNQLKAKIYERMIEKLNGMVVIRDKQITGTLDQDSKIPFPKASEVIEMRANQSVFIPYNGLVCSTVMPYLPVQTHNLPGSISQFLHKKKIYAKQKIFYGLTIVPRADDLANSTISLYVRSKKKVDSYVLYNKNDQFVLKPTKRIIQMDGDMGKYAKEIQIFQGVFPTNEVKLTGKFVVIFEKDVSEPVFDCFMSANYQDVNIKSLFTYSIAISEEQKMIKRILERFEEENTLSYFILSIFRNPIFLIFLGALFCFLLYLIVKSNVKADNSNDFIDPLNNIKHDEEVVRQI